MAARSAPLFLAALCAVSCVGAHGANQAYEASGALVLPDLPTTAPIPEHVGAAEHLDGIGVPHGGTPEVRGEWVCYDSDSHLRLTLALTSDERRSDARAREAWRSGWLKCQSSHLPIIIEERQRSLRASLEPFADDGGWVEDVRDAAPWVSVALAVGFVGGAWVGAAYLGD